jgi:CheY-like chemotaxis protein
MATLSSGEPGRNTTGDPYTELSAARILVVDDNKSVRKIVRAVLEGLAGGVFEADGGLAGIRAWSQLKPDLVFVDFEMPRVNGAVLTKYIRERERGANRRTAVLMMTAHGDAEHVGAARAADVDGLIGKPLSVGLILERALRALARSQQRLLEGDSGRRVIG